MKWRRHQGPAADPAEGEVCLRGFDDFDTTLGDLMRGERATLGKSLLDVQRDLRIPAERIAAIETGDLAAFEAPSFIAGYVRSYARYLGMDPEWAYRKFCDESGFVLAHGLAPEASPRRARAVIDDAREPADAFLSPEVPFLPRRLPLWERVEPGALGSAVLLALLVVAIGYGGWSVLRELQQVQVTPIDQAPQVAVQIDPLGNVGRAEGGAAVAAPAEASAAVALEQFYRPDALPVPVLTPRDGPIAAIEPGTMDPAPIPEAPQAAQIDALIAEVLGPGAAAQAEPEEVAVAGPVQVFAEPPPPVEIVAVRPAWVRVQAADGTVLFEKILDAGERYRVPVSEAPPVLRAGNSGAVYFLLDGTAHGPASTTRQVVRNVVLSPDALAGAYAPADLARDADLSRLVELRPAAGGN
jgi:cytoskeletal protein RodZ